MKSNNKTIAYIAFYIASIIFVILFFTIFSKNSSSDKAAYRRGDFSAREQLSNESTLLLNRLKQLQKLDEKYSALFVQSKITPAMDSVDTEISKQEYIFSNIIDSFDNKKVDYPNANDREMFEKIDTFFKQALQSRSTIGRIRYALAAGNFDFDSSQKKWLKLNSELIIKDDRISTLEDVLKTGKYASTAENSTSGTDLLTSVRESPEKTNSNLVRENTLLKENIKTLKNDLAKFSRSAKTVKGNSNEDSKNASGNMVDNLNAEIQLAKISCNLTRADVKQIISNSKQRKELLSEALKQLNVLSKADNPEIQAKAREKLNELYKISETIRD